MAVRAILLGALLLLSSFPLVHADSSSPTGFGGEPEQVFQGSAVQRGQALLQPLNEFLSGSSALAVRGLDFRLQRPDSQALSEFGSQGGSAILQAPTAALVPFRSPTQRFSRNLLLTRDLGLFPFQTEPSIAVDPKNPDHLVAMVIDYNSPNVVSYVSMNRGSTWEGPYQPLYPPEDIGAGGDPSVAFDRNGNVYASSISIGFQDFNIAGLSYEVTTSGVSVASSTDGGVSWGRPTDSSKSSVSYNFTVVTQGTGGHIDIGFLDKPWMTVGPNVADPTKDSIYVTYTHFVTHLDIVFALQGQLFYFANPIILSTIEMVHSEDGGGTWSNPLAVSPTVAFVAGGAPQRTVQGSQPAVAPDGTLYISWFDSTDDGTFKGLGEIWAARSDDGGKTFQSPVVVDERGEPGFTSRTSNFRSWSSAFPQIAVGPKGEVSLAYVLKPSDKPTDDGDVYFATSTDRGVTWSHRRVQDDNTTAFQFFPSIAYDPKGKIHMMWGDFRDDRTEKSFNIYYSRSEDGGKTWTENARVTDFPSNPNRGFPRGEFMGDYFSIKATDGDVFMVWADSRLGEFGTPDQKIAFARVSPMKSSSIFVSPPRGTAGRLVEIQGFDFQPQLGYFVSVSGNIVTSSRTDKDGRFDLRLFMPIASQGSQDITVFDETGNTAVASFFIDVGFDTINQQLNQTLAALSNPTTHNSTATSTSTAASTQPTEQLGPAVTALWAAAGISTVAVALALVTVVLVLRRIPKSAKPKRETESPGSSARNGS